jgi:hypothetical protein
MRGTSVPIVAIVLVLVVAVSIVALASSRPSDAEPSGSSRVVVPQTSKEPSLTATEALAYEGPSFGLPGSASPTTFGNQSKLWYVDGTWWGAMLEPASGQVRVHRLDMADQEWIDTGVTIDERGFARSDVLWDGEHLYVASAGYAARQGHVARIARFSYDSDRQRFLADADFPVTITRAGVEAINLARTASGTLWVSYLDDGRLVVNHTLNSDLVWADPFSLTVDGNPPEIDQAALVALRDSIVVVWTTVTDDTVTMAVHDGESPDGQWSSQGITVEGLSLGDDQLNAAASEWRNTVYAVVRTSLDEEVGRSDLAPQLVLVELPLDGDPAAHLVARVGDGHTHPTIVLSEEEDKAIVVAARRGAIHFKVSSLDEIAFPSGIGLPLVSSNEAEPKISQPTSTKQQITDESGMVVLAADRDLGRYYYGVLAGDAGNVVSPPPSAPTDVQLAHDTFEGLPVGSPVAGRWVLPSASADAFSVAMLTDGESSARLTGGPPGEVLRACRPFPPTATGTLIVAVDILLNPLPVEDGPLVEVRGAGGELTSIRLRQGRVVYHDGETRVISDLQLEPGLWYRATITVDLGAGSSGITVSVAGQDDVLLEAADIAWRSEEAVDAARVCLALPAEPGLVLYADNLRVIATR